MQFQSSQSSLLRERVERLVRLYRRKLSWIPQPVVFIQSLQNGYGFGRGGDL